MLTQKEFNRQLMHMLVGLVAILLIYLDIFRSFTVFLLLIVGILISFLSKRVRLPVVSWFLDIFEREEQRYEFPGRGVIFFFVGVLLCLQLFPKNIAMAALMVLTLGDSVSHIMGAKYGEMQNVFNRKSRKLLEGTFFGALAGFLGAWIFVPFPEALLGAVVAMIAEVVQIDFNKREVDDNVVVPLVAGTVMLIVGYLI